MFPITSTEFFYVSSRDKVQFNLHSGSHFREVPEKVTYLKNYMSLSFGIPCVSLKFYFLKNIHKFTYFPNQTIDCILSKIFEDLLPIYGTEKEQDAINKVFPECENISIDYAIMEKAEEIYVFPASFGWSDLGTWGSLLENSERDIHGNSLIGENIDVYETTNCIVHATQEKRVVVQGLDGFIVAECDNTLLICRLSDEQRIKQFSESK